MKGGGGGSGSSKRQVRRSPPESATGLSPSVRVKLASFIDGQMMMESNYTGSFVKVPGFIEGNAINLIMSS